MCHVNPTAQGTLMDNVFQDQVEEDLNISSHEPATKGDLRNLALRVGSSLRPQLAQWE